MILSASKIKTLDTCSWLWNCSYHLKLPRTSNKGADLGTVTHLVLECLLNKRHRNHYEQLRLDKTCKNNDTICRLIKKHLSKMGHDSSELTAIDEFLQVALDTDFFIEGFELGEPEFKFEIKNENPKYHVIGFIDKFAKKDGIVKIFDYKSSKQKFSGKDLDFNIQAAVYQIAIKKLWPETRKSFVNFLMLRFKKNPLQVVSYSDKFLEGIELYMSYLTEYLSDWTYEKAISKFAANDPAKKMLCGSAEPGFKADGITPKWICPSRNAFKYFALLNQDGNVIKSEFKEEDLKPKEGETVKEMWYSGCPIFNK